MKKLIILLTLNVLFAQVPHKMSFQAYLTDANNMPVAPGSYEMIFRIYDALTEGSKVWEESQTVTVDGSVVSVMLGNTVPLIALSSAGYLEIQLKDEVLSPRQELGGTMFAIRAVNADKAMIADTATIAVGYAKLDTLRVYAKTGDIANTLDGLTDALVESNSIYVGNDPSSTTDEAQYNVALGMTALDAVTTGDYNTAVGHDALTSNSTGYGNTAFGYKSLYANNDESANMLAGYDNTATGAHSLSSNTIGYNNTATGARSLGSNTTGMNNTASGFKSLSSNTTGYYNTASGFWSLFLNRTGYYNTATGAGSLQLNDTGNNNTATGYMSLSSNTTGHANTALGADALSINKTASFNTAVGFEALAVANRTADVNAYNTAIGYKAGYTGTNDITTGDKNVLIGSSTAASNAAATNQIVIGHGASGTGNNKAVIGNSDITSLYAGSDGQAILYAYGIAQGSDRRIKKSINTLAYGLNFIMKLRPVSYFKLHPRDYPQELKDKFYPDGKIRQVGAEDYDKLQVGFIAQEVKAVNDEMHAENNIVSIDEDGFHRMDYEKIIVPLVKAVQEQQAQIAEFVKGAKAQETQITELQNKINAIMEMQASALASKSYGEGDQ